MSNPIALTDAQRRKHHSAIGRRMQAKTPDTVEAMKSLLSSSIEPLGQDPSLVEMLHASIDGNVSTLCHIFSNDIGVESMQPNTGAVAYAVRLAQRDVPVSALTRAYYLGQAMLVREVLDAADTLDIEDPAEKMAVVRSAVDAVHRYIDWILKYVNEAHEAEQRRWWAARATTNAASVLRVLRRELLSTADFAAATGYSLEHNHLAVIAWLDFDNGGTDEQRRTDRLLRKVASALGSLRPPLITAADRSTAWAWINLPTGDLGSFARERIADLCGDRAARDIRLALGRVGTGVDGFRRSHQQAERARLVALETHHYQSAPSVAFSDPNVALLSLVMNDLPGAVSWMKEVLGPLAEPGEANAVLRETLSHFYITGENFTRTAEHLGLHRNTVHQRVSKFDSTRGDRHVDTLELALALRLFELLGD